MCQLLKIGFTIPVLTLIGVNFGYASLKSFVDKL